jgi:hypothetical protein
MKTLLNDQRAVNIAKALAAGASIDLLAREMVQNALDKGATVIDFFRGLSGYEGKLVMYDNGSGLASLQEMIDRLSVPGSASTSADNFGVGLRVLAIKAARDGGNDYPYLIVISQDKTGLARQIKVYLNAYEVGYVPRIGTERGTYTIITGSHEGHKTEVIGGRKVDWIDKAINSRFLRIPSKVKVIAKSDRGGDGSIIVRTHPKGLLDLLEKEGAEQIGGTASISGFRTTFYKLPKKMSKNELSRHSNFKPTRASESNELAIGGQILHIYNGEVYNHESGADFPIERAGITNSKGSMLLLVEPENTHMYRPNLLRNSITCGRDENFGSVDPSMNLSSLFEVYRKLAPKVVRDFINKEAIKGESVRKINNGANFLDRAIRFLGDTFHLSKKGSLQHVKTAEEQQVSLDWKQNTGTGKVLTANPDNPLDVTRTKLVAGPQKGKRQRVHANYEFPTISISRQEGRPDSHLWHLNPNGPKEYNFALNTASLHVDYALTSPEARRRGLTRESILDILEESFDDLKALSLIGLHRQAPNGAGKDVLGDPAISAAMFNMVDLAKKISQEVDVRVS